MAWSDAARAAALEARRMHSRAKTSGAIQVGTRTASQYKGSIMGHKEYRVRLAHEIKSMRRGAQGHARYDPIQKAVMSTAYRNALRK